jgi:hypothetical protein
MILGTYKYVIRLAIHFAYDTVQAEADPGGDERWPGPPYASAPLNHIQQGLVMVWAKHRPNPNELDLNRASPRQLGQGHNDMYVNHMQNNRLIHAMRRIRFP